MIEFSDQLSQDNWYLILAIKVQSLIPLDFEVKVSINAVESTNI